MFRIPFPKYRAILGMRLACQRTEASASTTALPTTWAPASLLLTSLTLAFPALAGRPLITDDADVVAPGACQVESWMARTQNEGPSTTALWLNAACTPIDQTEFAVGGARDLSGRDRGTVTTWQIKHVFQRDDDVSPGYAIALADQRDRRIHRNAMGDTSAIGIASFPLAGEALMAHLNAGITRAWHADTRRYRGRGIWSSALDADVARNTRAAIEAYGMAGERPAWQISVRYDLTPDRLQIDASAGRTFGRGDADQIVTVGLVITTASLLH